MTTPRGSWALRDRPGVVWMALAVLLALVHPFVPGSQWLMVHLVLLGALTHSAMVWSTHFTQALLKTPASIDDRTQQNRRIGLLVGGVSAVLVGVPTSLWPLTVLGASAVSTAILWHGVQLWRRLRRALRAGSASRCATTSRRPPSCPSAPGSGPAWPVGSARRCTAESSSPTPWSWCWDGSDSP